MASGTRKILDDIFTRKPKVVPENVPDNVHVKVDEIVNESVPENKNVLVSVIVNEEVSETVDVGVLKDVLENVDINVLEDEYVHVPYVVHNKSSAKKDWKPKVNSFEALYTRKTVWIRDDLLKSLNELSVSKGDITSNLNEGLEMLFKKKLKKNKGE